MTGLRAEERSRLIKTERNLAVETLASSRPDHRRVKIPDPDPFSGNLTPMQYETWKSNMKEKIEFDFRPDEQGLRRMYLFSRLRDQAAELFIQYRDAKGLELLEGQILEELDSVYGIKDTKAHAAAELQLLEQRNTLLKDSSRSFSSWLNELVMKRSS
jgi:hypothetical protein